MTTDTKPLTRPQVNALRALRDLCDEPIGTLRRPAGWATPRSVAMALWPDSPAWTTRTRMYNGRNGAVGGTMPMKAASVLWRLHPRFADCADRNHWSITAAGRRYLAEHDQGGDA